MNKIYLSAMKYRELLNKLGEYVMVDLASCDYCGLPHEKDKYHPDTCAHCGAELRGLTHFVIDPSTFELSELVCTG